MTSWNIHPENLNPMINKSRLTDIISFIESSFQALIFDLDGTLTDSNPAHLKAWTQACKHFGLAYPRKQFYYFAGLPSIDIAEEIIRMHHKENMISPKALSDRKEETFDLLQDMVKPVPQTFSIVKHFYGKLPLAIGTGRSKSSTMGTLFHLGLTKYFDVIITADDVNKHKPAPDTFLECANHMHVAPEKCLVFEDAERGIKAAANAGMEILDVRSWLAPMKL